MTAQKMISCDECQKTLVALLDNEAGEADEARISAHLKQCAQCMAFQEDVLRLRHEFASVAMPGVPAMKGQELLRAADADGLAGKTSRDPKGTRRQPSRRWLGRLARAAGLASVVLLVLSWLVCVNLARQVADLKRDLHAAERDLTVLREQQQFEEEQAQLELAQERQQKAISALHFRMQELEEEFERFLPPKTVFVPRELYDFPHRQRGS
ncbi:MAG: zf-HC2 domain-containing protein [Planctomycetota bacterium]